MSELETLKNKVLNQYLSAREQISFLTEIVQIIKEEFTGDIQASIQGYDYISHEQSAAVHIAFTAPHKDPRKESPETTDLRFSVIPKTEERGPALHLDMPVQTPSEQEPVLTLKLRTLDSETYELNVSSNPRHRLQKTFSKHVELSEDTNFYIQGTKRDEVLLRVYEALNSQFLPVAKHSRNRKEKTQEEGLL